VTSLRVLSVAAALAVLPGCIFPVAHQKRPPPLPRDGLSDTSYVLVNNTWIRVRDMGPAQAEGKRPLLLVHGYGSWLDSWKLVQPELAKDRRVVSLDLKGFGLSEKPQGAYGPEAHAREVTRLADQLGLERPILVGHSYGGGVVLRAVLRSEESFSGVVLVSAYALSEQVFRAFRWARVPVLGEFLFWVVFRDLPGEKFAMAFHDRKRFATPEAIDDYGEHVTRPGAIYAGLQTVRGMDYQEAERQYNTITLPVLMVYGDDDRTTTPAHAKDLAARLDRGRLLMLERCGHVPPWERPGALTRAIRDFADAIDQGKQP
jgi:pimeloyl-ACP methyl ester carboxylesterase